jgi:hypothetical protein
MGGSVVALAAKSTNLFAGVNGGGVLQSNDNGTNWTADGEMEWGVNVLAVSGTSLFAGTGGGGVWRCPL